MNGRSGESERGSAVVDAVLVGGLLGLLVLAVLQLVLAVHVRTTLVDCAGEGARFGALADRDPQAGVQRARDLIAADLSEAYADDVEAGRETFDGLETVVVRVRAPLPLLGLLGPRTLVVEGHARAGAP